MRMQRRLVASVRRSNSRLADCCRAAQAGPSEFWSVLVCDRRACRKFGQSSRWFPWSIAHLLGLCLVAYIQCVGQMWTLSVCCSWCPTPKFDRPVAFSGPQCTIRVLFFRIQTLQGVHNWSWNSKQRNKSIKRNNWCRILNARSR